MPRFYHIYGPFSDRKRCRFDQPGNPKTGRIDIAILTMGTVNHKRRLFLNVFQHMEVATTRVR